MNAAVAIRILALAQARAEVRATIKAILGDAAFRAMSRAELERMARETLAPRHHIRAAGMWTRVRADALQNSKHSQRAAKRCATGGCRLQNSVAKGGTE